MGKRQSASSRVVVAEARAAGERGAKGSVILSRARTASLLISTANRFPETDEDVDEGILDGYNAHVRLTRSLPSACVGDLAAKLALLVQTMLQEADDRPNPDLALAASALSDAVLLQHAPLDGGQAAGGALETLAALSTPPAQG